MKSSHVTVGVVLIGLNMLFFGLIRTSTSPVTKQQLLSSSIRSRVLAPKFISKFPRVHLESKNFYTNGRHDSKRCLASGVHSLRTAAIATKAVSHLGSNQLSIWSFNLRSDFNAEKDGEDRWDARKDGVVEMLSRYNPDIIASQELIAQQVTYLGDHLSGYEFEGCCRLGSDADEYCAIFYKKDKFDVVDGDTVWLSETPEEPASIGWDAMYPRIATWSVFKFKSTGALVTVISTHFDHQGIEARKRSAGLLKNMVKRLQEAFPESPVMLCGDFNSIKADNEVYRTLTTGEGALVDAWDTAAEREDGGWKRSTMHKFKGTEFDGCMGDGTVELCRIDEPTIMPTASNGKEHIDWILYTNAKAGQVNVKPLKSSVVIDTLPSGRYPSDHFPVKTDVHIAA